VLYLHSGGFDRLFPPLPITLHSLTAAASPAVAMTTMTSRLSWRRRSRDDDVITPDGLMNSDGNDQTSKCWLIGQNSLPAKQRRKYTVALEVRALSLSAWYALFFLFY